MGRECNVSCGKYGVRYGYGVRPLSVIVVVVIVVLCLDFLESFSTHRLEMNHGGLATRAVAFLFDVVQEVKRIG